MGAFFTATSMIGFMAGAGIVVRNSIILVDFIELRLREGMPLARGGDRCGRRAFPADAAHRRCAVIVGACVILFDPIFQGLAIALMAGEIASLAISRMAVPVLYFMAFNRKSTSRILGSYAPRREVAPRALQRAIEDRFPRGMQGTIGPLVPEAGLEPALPCGKGILRRERRGSSSTFC